MKSRDKVLVIVLIILLIVISITSVLLIKKSKDDSGSSEESEYSSEELPVSGIISDVLEGGKTPEKADEDSEKASDSESQDEQDGESGAIQYNPSAFYLSGSKCAVVGDSIVEHDGFETSAEPGVIMYGIQSYLKHNCGVIEAANLGESGDSIADASGDHQILDIVQENDFSKYDWVMISGGVNDFMFMNSKIGSVTDGDYDTTTYCGAYQAMIEKIITDNPKANIIVCTPIQCVGSSKANSLGLTLKDYADATKAVASHYGIPVCDFFNYAGFTEADAETLTQDGLHPNNDGYLYLCTECMIPFLETL